MLNRKKLGKIIEKYITLILYGNSWTKEKYIKNMIRAIEKIMKYKKEINNEKTKKKGKCHYLGACNPYNPFAPRDCKKCNCYY